MAMFLSLDKFWATSKLKSVGASQHPDEAVCHFIFSLHILAMTSSSDALLDHNADYLQFISNSNAQSFWLTLNTSKTMAATSPVNSVWTRKTTRLCCLLSRRPGVSCHASWLLHRLLPSSHCAALLSSCRRASWLLHCLLPSSHLCCPLVVLSHQLLHCLSPSSCCATLSSTHHASLLLHCLSLSSCCTPRCPFVLLSHRLVVSPLDVPPSRCLVISSCCLSLSCRASWLSRHHLLSSSCCTALSSSHRAGWLLRCLSLCRPLVLSS